MKTLNKYWAEIVDLYNNDSEAASVGSSKCDYSGNRRLYTYLFVSQNLGHIKLYKRFPMRMYLDWVPQDMRNSLEHEVVAFLRKKRKLITVNILCDSPGK